jgi:hypothetical protein
MARAKAGALDHRFSGQYRTMAQSAQTLLVTRATIAGRASVVLERAPLGYAVEGITAKQI